MNCLKRKNLAALAFAILGGGMLLCSCGGGGGLGEPSKDFPVETLKATETEVSESYPATIRGKQDIEIRPLVSGLVTGVCVEEGARVRQGQTLFTINSVEYKAAVDRAVAAELTAKAALATAELTYKNKKELFAQKIIGDFELSSAEQALAQSKAQLAQATAAVVSARQSLSYCNVTAPASGVIGNIPFRVGALVGPSMAQPLTTVSNIDEMQVYFSMTERDMLAMAQDGKELAEAFPAVQLQLADGTIYSESGKVTTVSGVINQATGTLSVRADFKNPNHLLKSGGMGNIIVRKTYENALLIPQSVTVEVQNKKFVYVVGADNKVTYTAVEVEPNDDGINYIVKSGLTAGMRYVTNGITKLQDGMEINPITPAQYAKNLQEAQKLGEAQGDAEKMKAAFSK